jgi:hypothetical protein
MASLFRKIFKPAGGPGPVKEPDAGLVEPGSEKAGEPVGLGSPGAIRGFDPQPEPPGDAAGISPPDNIELQPGGTQGGNTGDPIPTESLSFHFDVFSPKLNGDETAGSIPKLEGEETAGFFPKLEGEETAGSIWKLEGELLRAQRGEAQDDGLLLPAVQPEDGGDPHALALNFIKHSEGEEKFDAELGGDPQNTGAPVPHDMLSINFAKVEGEDGLGFAEEQDSEGLLLPAVQKVYGDAARRGGEGDADLEGFVAPGDTGEKFEKGPEEIEIESFSWGASQAGEERAAADAFKADGAPGAEELPGDSVSFNFAKLEIPAVQQGGDGGKPADFLDQDGLLEEEGSTLVDLSPRAGAVTHLREGLGGPDTAPDLDADDIDFDDAG